MSPRSCLTTLVAAKLNELLRSLSAREDLDDRRRRLGNAWGEVCCENLRVNLTTLDSIRFGY